jgi:hypothetical protein
MDSGPTRECITEHAIVERLLRASMDIHATLPLVDEQRTARRLHQAVACLDDSIKQVQRRALDLQLGPRPERASTPARTLRRFLAHSAWPTPRAAVKPR